MRTTTVILAAGQGTRMKSETPKVLHPLLGKPMLAYSVEAAQQLSGEMPVVVIGHGGEMVRKELGNRVRYVLQPEQLGTGHALQQTEPVLKGLTDQILVINADMPLLRTETLTNLVVASQENTSPVTMLTVIDENPRGFGRLVRDSQGLVCGIVEEAQASSEQLAIHELNPGVYCFRADWLWTALTRVPLSPKGEYYLTDVIEIAVADGYQVHTIPISDSSETIGINTRVHLAEAERVMQQRVNHAWMMAGVTMIDPRTTYIETGVKIGSDTRLLPNCILSGNTVIGSHCEIGPNTMIKDTQIGNRCKVVASVVERAILEDDVDAGPFAHLRKGAHLQQGVHMGNFGEIKNSTLGPGSKMGHFSYIGDANIGAQVNIGAGTITCNYDGEKKNITVIGDDVFIGSDTMLVAPVEIGTGARTGAGAVVTKDVPPHSLAVGVPARVIRKLEHHD